VNKVSRSGFAPLCIAAFWGADQLVKLLLKSGANVNVANYGSKWTPMHCAAFQGHGKVIMYLMEHSPDLSLQDSQGRTAVDFAATTTKIWGFFAAKGCTKPSKQELVAKGIIRKVEVTDEKSLNGTCGDDDPLNPNAGLRYADFSRPGSAYVVSGQSAASSRPATGASRAGSRPHSRQGSRHSSRPSSNDSIQEGVQILSLEENEDAVNRAVNFGDVLSLPSPVMEENEEVKF